MQIVSVLMSVVILFSAIGVMVATFATYRVQMILALKGLPRQTEGAVYGISATPFGSTSIRSTSIRSKMAGHAIILTEVTPLALAS